MNKSQYNSHIPQDQRITKMETLEILKALAKQMYDLSIEAENRSKHFETGSAARASYYAKSQAYSIALEAVNIQIAAQVGKLTAALQNVYS